MRTSHSYLTLLLLSFGLASVQGCEAPRRDVFILDSIKVLEPRGELREVLTWPIVVAGPVRDNLKTPSLAIIQGRLQEGLVQKHFSPLSLDLVNGYSKQYGATRTGASRALQASKADAVLVMSLGEWDETGLFTLGRVRCKGAIHLLDKTGSVRWGGDIKVDASLVPMSSKNVSLEEKRRLAVESFARQVARRLPSQF